MAADPARPAAGVVPAPVRRRLPAAIVAAVTVAALAVPALATTGRPGDTPMSAVVALSGDRAVTVPGVRLVRLLPAVQAEVVRGTRAALDTLSRAAGVIGLSPDRPVRLQAKAFTGDGVYAPDTVTGLPAGAGRHVTVAVIDTGVSDTAALNRSSGRLHDAVDTSDLSDPNGKGVVTEDGTFADGYGHGTYVASLIAGGSVPGAPGTASLGIAPAADVDVVKVADDHGRTSLASVVAGLDWVATHAAHVQVANLSLSVARPTDGYGVDPLNLAVRLTREQGVAVVVAAGNTAGQVSDPGFDPAAFTVGAYDPTTGRVADFSGSGVVAGMTKPDVVAAGVHVTGEVPADSFVARTNSRVVRSDGARDALVPGTGTSGATALVSGLAAAFLSAHPDATADQVAASLRSSATAVSGGRAGAGLVSLPETVTDGPAPHYPSGWDETRAAWPDQFWADPLWSGPWSAHTWDTRSWSTRSWTTRSWTTRSWTTRSWTTRSWTTRSWTEGPWSVTGWGP